jgi:ELWxxDGT repeat protein
MRAGRAVLFFGLSVLCAGGANGQPAHRVADLDPSTATGSSWVSTSLTSFQGAIYFGASGIGSVGQLWSSQGTPGSTRLLEEFTSPLGYQPYALAPFADRLLFFVGGSLWAAGADAENLTLVHEFPSLVYSWAPTPSGFFFTADDGIHGFELWRSDGTPSGTGMVADLEPGAAGSNPHGLTVEGSKLFFFTTDGSGQSTLWQSDGSYFGTRRVVDLPAGVFQDSQTPPAAAGGLFFFIGQVAEEEVHPYQLWRSDGTAAGTFPVGDYAFDYPGACPLGCYPYGPSDLAALGDRVVFIANDGVHGREIWASDGTAAGTAMLRDIQPPEEANPLFRTLAAGAYVYFAATDSTHGTELWRTDGTTAGTVLVEDIEAGEASSDPYPQAAIAGRLVFTRRFYGRFEGLEIWESDGTAAGTRRLASVDAPSASLFAGISDALVFVTGDGGGSNLWRSDGTDAGTLRVERFETGAGSYPSILHPFSGRVAFSLFDASSLTPRPALWTSDGTAEGTFQLRELLVSGGGFTSRQSAPMRGELFIAASDTEYGMELWGTDGTPEGTRLVRDILPGAGDSGPFGMTAALDRLFFAAWNGERVALFSTDGTGAGTRQVSDVTPFTEGEAFLPVGGLLFFVAGDVDHGGELWRTDGTDAGTVLVKDINPGPDGSSVSSLAPLGGIAVFGAWNGVSWGLWRSDGSAAGTVRIREVPGWLLGPRVANGLAYFTVGENSELWVSDGTESGTRRLSTVRAALLTAAGSLLFFVGDDGARGPELWRSDGTEPGTHRVRDIRPGAPGSIESWNLGAMVAAGERVIFAADDGEHGIELWLSDGTEAGTSMLQDIWHGRASSRPAGLVRAGDTVFFNADDGVTGTELWAVPVAAGPSSPRGTIRPELRPNRPTRRLTRP